MQGRGQLSQKLYLLGEMKKGILVSTRGSIQGYPSHHTSVATCGLDLLYYNLLVQLLYVAINYLVVLSKFSAVSHAEEKNA